MENGEGAEEAWIKAEEIEGAPEVELEPLEELKDKYFRLLAEGENQRKRLQKEKLEAIKYGEISMIRSFLEPIDQLDTALKFAALSSPEVKQWALGFEMVLGQFKEILHRYRVSSFQSVGHPFDPEKHEAIDMEEREGATAGTILEEYLKGYAMDGRTIRPAKVKVAKAKMNENEQHEKA